MLKQKSREACIVAIWRNLSLNVTSPHREAGVAAQHGSWPAKSIKARGLRSGALHGYARHLLQ